MDDSVGKEHVRLNDLGGDVAGGDVVTGGVQHERQRLARGGGKVRARKEGRVDRGAVNELHIATRT